MIRLRSVCNGNLQRQGLKGAVNQTRRFTTSNRTFSPLSVLPNNVDVNSDAYKSNFTSMSSLVNEMDSLHSKIALGGPEKARQRHIKRGKMLARDRIGALLDPGSPFLEFSSLAGWDMYGSPDEVPGGGVITGIGTVSGTQTLILANDPTVKNQVVLLYLTKRMFFLMHIILVVSLQKWHKCPPLVKAALGEDVDDETLGGGEMHCSQSGVTDHLAIDDAHAIALAREAIANLGRAGGSVPSSTTLSPANSSMAAPYEAPLYDPSELHGIVPTNLRQPFDMRDVIARIVDGSRFHEFKKLYGPTLVTGFASIAGQPVGIIGNNGVLFSSSAQKATSFIQLCNQRQIPLVFLVNVTGYMVGTKAEQAGIAKDGAKMVRAVACADVPKMTVVIGGSYGAGNYGMNGRAYGPRFLFMWPTARVGVMGGDQLASVMSTVSSDPKRIAVYVIKLKRKVHHNMLLQDYGMMV
ncbi:hypothetical protein L7F22_043559 [Adiantum nelumboides]|nr:hypothetical protein [Adiantum nelumboides]